MQLDAAVVGAGQAAAAEAAGLHAEVAPVLLHHDVRGELGGAEEAVLALVDVNRLVDAVEVGTGIGDSPSGCRSSFSGNSLGLSP